METRNLEVGEVKGLSLLSTDPHGASAQLVPTPEELPKQAGELGSQLALHNLK